MDWGTHVAEAVEAARFLFLRNKVSGSSANLSFLYGGKCYITCSGACFGRLEKEDFSELTMEGEWVSGKKPSKEWPVHLALYQSRQDIQAVIHTHGRYGVLWSFEATLDPDDCIPHNTPYLQMKVGKVGLVDYHMPGSRELFEAFKARTHQCKAKAYLLKQHGPIVGGSCVMDAFYNLEELEEACAIAWGLQKTSGHKGIKQRPA